SFGCAILYPYSYSNYWSEKWENNAHHETKWDTSRNKNSIILVDWEMWEMKHFGDFVSNLRGSAGLSLEALAILVESSKSTLSRLENGDIPQPFKGPTRKLVIALAEILCTSKKETKRYLELAGIDQSLLTEAEEIQLGFAPAIPTNPVEETATLQRLERTYTQLLSQLEEREQRLGISSTPPNLKVKIQEYTNILQEIQKKLDKMNNSQESTEPDIVQAIPVHYAEALEGKLVVGHQYGESLHATLRSYSLYSLASSNARWLMQLADVERFVVEDCIILTNSKNFEGWSRDEIQTTVLNT